MWQVHARNAAAAGVVAGHSKEMPPGRVGAQQAAVRDRFACRQPATTGRASQHERILAAHRARERRLPNRLEFVQLHALKLRRPPPDERFDSGRIGSRAGWVAWLRAGWRGCGLGGVAAGWVAWLRPPHWPGPVPLVSASGRGGAGCLLAFVQTSCTPNGFFGVCAVIGGRFGHGRAASQLNQAIEDARARSAAPRPEPPTGQISPSGP